MLRSSSRAHAPLEIDIESLDIEARGVGRADDPEGTPGKGKVIFVEGALPGERVTYSSYRKKARFEQAQLVHVRRVSSARVAPACGFFGVCGGCSMQHLDARAQLAVKQRGLEANLWHLGKVRPATLFRPIHGPTGRYRHRARLTVRHVEKKGGMLIGFHERKSSFVADMTSCEVLPAHVSALLVPLRELIGELSIFNRVPQIELAVGDSVTALVLRALEPPSAADEDQLRAFADRYGVQFWLQAQGPESARVFYPDRPMLEYTLPESGVRMQFKPTDFTQVNPWINRVLVSRAVRLLAPTPEDRVVDLFCGLGNFTLPLARYAREVIGLEGNAALLSRARENASMNGLEKKVAFATRNLFEFSADELLALGGFDKMLIDPPREGALAVAKALADAEKAQRGKASGTPCASDAEAQKRIRAGRLPARIVYISCNPATLARDAGILVHEAGYRLGGAGVVNMFPHTSHVESIALFERA